MNKLKASLNKSKHQNTGNLINGKQYIKVKIVKNFGSLGLVINNEGMITAIDPSGSMASKQELAPGDKIVDIEGLPTFTYDKPVSDIINDHAKAGSAWNVGIERNPNVHIDVQDYAAQLELENRKKQEAKERARREAAARAAQAQQASSGGGSPMPQQAARAQPTSANDAALRDFFELFEAQGYERSRLQAALEAHNNDTNRAADWLLSGGFDKNTEAAAAPPPQTPGPQPADLLGDLSFDSTPAPPPSAPAQQGGQGAADPFGASGGGGFGGGSGPDPFEASGAFGSPTPGADPFASAAIPQGTGGADPFGASAFGSCAPPHPPAQPSAHPFSASMAPQGQTGAAGFGGTGAGDPFGGGGLAVASGSPATGPTPASTLAGAMATMALQPAAPGGGQSMGSGGATGQMGGGMGGAMGQMGSGMHPMGGAGGMLPMGGAGMGQMGGGNGVPQMGNRGGMGQMGAGGMMGGGGMGQMGGGLVGGMPQMGGGMGQVGGGMGQMGRGSVMPATGGGGMGQMGGGGGMMGSGGMGGGMLLMGASMATPSSTPAATSQSMPATSSVSQDPFANLMSGTGLSTGAASKPSVPAQKSQAGLSMSQLSTMQGVATSQTPQMGQGGCGSSPFGAAQMGEIRQAPSHSTDPFSSCGGMGAVSTQGGFGSGGQGSDPFATTGAGQQPGPGPNDAAGGEVGNPFL